MNMCIRLVMALVLVNSVLWFTTTHQLATHLMASLLAVPLSLSVRPRDRITSRRRIGPHRRTQTTFGGQMVAGLVTGGLTILCVASFSAVQHHWPTLRTWWTDSDRSRLDGQLTHCEVTADWSAAINIIEKRRRQPISSSWSTALAWRQFQERLYAAAEAPDPVFALTTLRAESFDEFPEPRLLSLILEGLHASEELPRVQQRLTRLEREAVAHERELALAHVQTLLSAADDIHDSPLEARDLLERARALDTRYQLNNPSVRNRWEVWQPPRELPHASAVELVRTHHDEISHTFDFTIRDADQQPISGLSKRDFRIRRGDQPLRRFSVLPKSLTDRRLYVALLLDCSGSTKGEPMSASVAGSSLLADSLNGAATLRLWSFADQVTATGDWTGTASEVVAAVKRLQAGGQTSLLRALDTASGDLIRQLGQRTLVLFSDGADNIGGPSIASIITRCREHDVSIHVIALQTADLDLPLLKRLAEETGGQLHVATAANDLVMAFAALADSLHQPVYRITLLRDDTTTSPLQVLIGNEPSHLVEIDY